jgi:HK97 family phage portal protein
VASLIGKALALRNAAPPAPVPVARAYRGSSLLTATQYDIEALLRAPAFMGTVYSIVSLYAESVGRVDWKLYRKQPADARRRYAPHTDTGSDQRTEVVQHAALDLISRPNPFSTRFTLFEQDQQFLDLTGEWYWVLTRDPRATFPLGAWPVRPDRMTPVPDPERFLAGWIYASPDGREKIPLAVDDVIQGKYPNPLDMMRGLGPVQSVLMDIDAARFSTAWNRQFFLNSAEPRGVVEMPGNLDDPEFDEFQMRWAETHQGISAAHKVAMLENGAKWVPNQMSIRDMDFANLRSLARDVVREAFRSQKVMLGVSDDVNRANAQTGQEVFAAWGTVPRLDRKKDVLNNRLLPMFGSTGTGVEFDYVNPVPANRELDQAELTAKVTAAVALIGIGFDPSEVLEMVGLPEMSMAELTAAAAPPVPAPAPAQGGDGTSQADMEARLRRMLGNGHLPVPELDSRTMRALRQLAGRSLCRLAVRSAPRGTS